MIINKNLSAHQTKLKYWYKSKRFKEILKAELSNLEEVPDITKLPKIEYKKHLSWDEWFDSTIDSNLV